MAGLDQTIATMKALRLDFAQQIPRGSSFKSDSSGNEERSGRTPARP
jgi:hypothetical protein